MRTFRIVTPDGIEVANLQAASLAEVIAMAPATAAPLGTQIMNAEGSKVLARRELWTGGCPGWSLALAQPT